MTSLALIAAKGSPGVTTLACAMVLARADSGAVLLEADPAGGDLAVLHGVSQSPGLAQLAARAKRPGPGGDLLAPYIRPLAGGALPAVLAPVDGAAVRAALDVLADRAELLGRHDPGRTLVFDLGRTEPNSPGWLWLTACDRVLLVTRRDLTALAHAALLAERLRESAVNASFVLIDEGAFQAAEAEEVLNLSLVGVIPFHPKQARALTDPESAHAAVSNRLTARAGDVLDTLLQHTEVPVA